MKLHFESDLKYQADAIEAVCGLFHGQEICRSEFTVTVNAGRHVPLMEEASPDMFGGASPQLSLGIAESDLGVGNRLTLLDDQLAKNLSDTQLRNGLPPTGAVQLTGDFTVEMETGTGKTYVYLRTGGQKAWSFGRRATGSSSAFGSGATFHRHTTVKAEARCKSIQGHEGSGHLDSAHQSKNK